MPMRTMLRFFRAASRRVNIVDSQILFVPAKTDQKSLKTGDAESALMEFHLHGFPCSTPYLQGLFMRYPMATYNGETHGDLSRKLEKFQSR